MFRTKKEKAQDLVNIFDVRVTEITNHVKERLNFGFDVMCERDRLQDELDKLRLKAKDKDTCISALKKDLELQAKLFEEKEKKYLEDIAKVATELKEEKAEKKKLSDYLDKSTEIWKNINEGYVLKKKRTRVKDAVPKKRQAIGTRGTKSSAIKSEIIKKVKEGNE